MISAQFQRRAAPDLSAIDRGSPPKEPFFGKTFRASFQALSDGVLVARVEDEPLARSAQPRLTSRFPPSAAGELRVEVEGESWLKERLAGAASSARAEVVDGRLVYAAARRGVDRVYEVTGQRVEEYLRIADERAASELASGVAVCAALSMRLQAALAQQLRRNLRLEGLQMTHDAQRQIGLSLFDMNAGELNPAVR